MIRSGAHPQLRLPVLAIVVLMAVGACNASSTPAPAATSGPAATAAAAATAGAAAPVAGQFCSGMKIVFFPGGTPGGGFETVVYNGAKAAAGGLRPDDHLPVVRLGPEQDDHPVLSRRWRPSLTASPSWATRVTTPSIR